MIDVRNVFQVHKSTDSRRNQVSIFNENFGDARTHRTTAEQPHINRFHMIPVQRLSGSRFMVQQRKHTYPFSSFGSFSSLDRLNR